MSDVLLISNAKPDQQSLDFDSLREQGIDTIQNLASKIWTDYNTHDPGVTILEQLIYAITELGYKTNFDIKDILAQNPDDTKRIKTGLFTAPQILSNTPVHIDDFRKLLIDVEGIRNAFLKVANNTEFPVYIDHLKNIASYSGDELVNIRGLYSVILELDTNDEFGDLNNSIMDWSFNTIQGLQSINVNVEVSMPDWMAVSQTMRLQIKPNGDDTYPQIKNIVLADDSFVNVDRRTYAATITVTIDIVPEDMSHDDPDYIAPKTVDLPITILILDDVSKYDSTLLETHLQRSLHLPDPSDSQDVALASTIESLILDYNRKLMTIWDIANNAIARLNSYRNLCEDFISISNLQVEEVGLCLQIEVGPGADVEEIEAEIYFRVANFLSPRIQFHTATELLNKGMTVDQIFEGPVLDHGFLDLSEALTIDERKVLFVSDLIQIIMDIPGVISVGDIHLSSYIDNLLMNDEVDDCLAPTLEETHRMRLSVDKSSTIFYRDDDPTDPNKVFLVASRKNVKEKLRELEILENDLLIGNNADEFDAPEGSYRPLEDYYSVQNDFPVNYGVGTAGLSASATPLRNAQAKQLKSFLLFSEQLLANLLAQLSHIKELFSIDPSLKQTYFAQMVNIPNPFPEGDNSYQPYAHIDEFQYLLQDIIEGKELFIERRNKVLDHLLARFAEDFTNYSLKLYEVYGSGIEERLISDKLNFLNNLPVVSGERLRSYNMKDVGNTWNTDNVSGYQKRVSLKLGIGDFKRKSFSFAYEERAEDINQIFRLYEKLDGHAPAAAGTAVSTNAGSGSIDWTNPTAVTQEGEVTSPNEAHTALMNEGETSDYLVVTGFDFSFVPSDATIKGVRAEVVKRIDPATGVTIDGDIQDYEIKLVKAGTVTGANRANTEEVWSATRLYYPYGSATDMWGTTLTPSDVKNANFGIAIRVLKSGPRQRQANVDHVKLTVYYQKADHSEIITYHFETQPEARNFGIASPAIGYSSEAARENIITDVVNYGYSFCNYCKNDDASLGDPDYTIKRALTADDRDDMCTLNSYEAAQTDTNKVQIVNQNLVSKLTVGKEIMLGYVQATDDGSKTYEFRFTVQTATYVVPESDDPYTEVTTVETIALEHDVTLMGYYKLDSINVVYTGPGDDVTQDARDFADLVFDTFWNIEGMHVIEHLLLRPKVNKDLFVEIPANKIKGSDIGKVTYDIKINVTSVNLDYSTNTINFPIDIYNAVPAGTTIQLIDKYGNATPYTVKAVTGHDDYTFITIKEPLEEDEEIILMSYPRTFIIQEFDNANNSILVGTNYLNEITTLLANANVPEKFVFGIINSVYNNGLYQITSADNIVSEDTGIRFIIENIQANLNDALLPIVLSEDDCTCPELKDNYSFRISVVMPEWPARFTNGNFRKLVEKTLRYEAPAHVYVRLIWADRLQMKTFEAAYKTWLAEAALPVPDPTDVQATNDYQVALHNTHDTMVSQLFSLRNKFTGSVISDITEDGGSTGELSLLGQVYLG